MGINNKKCQMASSDQASTGSWSHWLWCTTSIDCSVSCNLQIGRMLTTNYDVLAEFLCNSNIIRGETWAPSQEPWIRGQANAFYNPHGLSTLYRFLVPTMAHDTFEDLMWCDQANWVRKSGILVLRWRQTKERLFLLPCCFDFLGKNLLTAYT